MAGSRSSRATGCAEAEYPLGERERDGSRQRQVNPAAERGASFYRFSRGQSRASGGLVPGSSTMMSHACSTPVAPAVDRTGLP